jgi:hypothetical protein
MANVDDPRGFLPYLIDGKTAKTRDYAKTAAAVVYEGDLVKRVAAGTVETSGAGVTTIIGVAAHFAAAADSVVALYDDPDMEFLVQSDGAVAYAVADNGLNVDIAAGTPDTTLRRSGQIVDIATKATTATLPIKILALGPEINSAANGAGVNALLRVKLNNVERSAGTTGV